MGNAQMTAIPQNDNDLATRQQNILNAQQTYQQEQKTFGLNEIQVAQVDLVNIPPLIRKLPRKEKRSCIDWLRFRFWQLFYSMYYLYNVWCGCCRWTISRMIHSFSSQWLVSKPEGFYVWRDQNVNTEEQTELERQQADHWFAWQRLNGVTRNLIRRVENVPARFEPFVEFIEQNHPYLGGMALIQHTNEDAGGQGLYVVDLTNIPIGPNELMEISPMALFVVWNNKLMPVAIRLTENEQVHIPVLVGNAENVEPWVNARMCFNMVEAQYHESITHLGFTHMLMDGVSVCMHRNLSDRHPIYKLLHPHFRYMHAINSDALKDLIEEGGFVDTQMNIGHVQMLQLIANTNSQRTYDLDANIEASFVDRGVMDLPGYFFRDDALQIRGAINQYVTEYTTHYYADDTAVQHDGEIQNFLQELTNARVMNPAPGEPVGCGMQGIPDFNGINNLVQVLTNFIYICSVEHSATNFPQFDQYGFPPNYPARLLLDNVAGMDNLNAIIPTRFGTVATSALMKVLTLRLTNSLGKYESTYVKAMDDFGRASVQTFQLNLNIIAAKINLRNWLLIQNNAQPGVVQHYPYKYLLPGNVLNSISI